MRQHPVFYDLSGKESFYIRDFYCHELKLVIDIDGKIHDHNKENDKQRDRIMNLLGLYVLRIKNEEIEFSITKVTNDIRKVVLELGIELTHPKSLS